MDSPKLKYISDILIKDHDTAVFTCKRFAFYEPPSLYLEHKQSNIIYIFKLILLQILFKRFLTIVGSKKNLIKNLKNLYIY